MQRDHEDLQSAAPGITRGRVLGGAGVAGTGLLAGGVLAAGLPAAATSAGSERQDRRILEFLLELEEMQAALYAGGTQRASLEGAPREFARIAEEHEREHIAAVREALGGTAPQAASYDFADKTRDSRTFLAAAAELEDIALSAYIGAAPDLTTSTLREAARILSVEARHAAWAAELTGAEPAPRASEEGRTQAQVRTRLRESGFVR